MNTKLKEVVYEYDLSRQKGMGVWLEMYLEVFNGRGLIWSLVVRDYSARFRQSIFGYLWVFLPAIASVVLFTYLRSANVFKVRETEIPFPAYMLFGLFIWQFFTGGLMATTASLAASGNLLSKINFPRECLVISAFVSSLFDILLRAILIGFVFVWFKLTPAWTIILLPIVLMPLVMFILGIGFILSIFNALIRDIGSALSMILGFVFFSVPVLYPPSTRWPHVILNDLNPVAAIIITAYDVTFRGFLTHPEGFMISVLASVLTFAMGWRIFHQAESLIAERV